MFWTKDEEETFKPRKEMKTPETEKASEVKINLIMDRLDLITKQVNLISKYLSSVSKRVSKAIDASVAYQRDLDELESRINQIKSRMEEIENVVPEVELKKELGRKAA